MLVIGNDVLDLKVVTLKKGKVVGEIKDILFNTNSQKVVGFLVSEKGIFSDTCFLPIENVYSIGPDALTIHSADYLQKSSASKQQADAKARSDHYLTNTQVITDSGSELGIVDDILFDSQTGKIEDLVITQSANSQFSGERKIPFSSVITLGKDNTIIKNETGDTKSDRNVAQNNGNNTENSFSQKTKNELRFLTDKMGDEVQNIDQEVSQSPFLDSMKEHASQIMDVLQRNTEKQDHVVNQNKPPQQSPPSYQPEDTTQNNNSHSTVYTHTINNPDRQNNDTVKKELEPGTYAVTGEINFDNVEEKRVKKKNELKGGEKNG